MRFIILSLRNNKGAIELDYALTLRLKDFDNHHSNILQINLDTGPVYLNRYKYVNKWVIYQDSKCDKVFFIVATYKQPNRKYALKFLTEFARSKKLEFGASKEIELVA